MEYNKGIDTNELILVAVALISYLVYETFFRD